MKTLIIIPAYNEASSITKVIRHIRAYASDTDILVIDDGSDDDTAVIVQQTGASVVVLPYNLGYGAALQTGYKYALREGYDRIIQMDADGQHDPVSIQALLKPLDNATADIVIGSRFLDSEHHYRAHIIRRIGMITFGKIVSLVLKQTCTDPTSGFQAMNRKVIAFYAQDHFPADFPDADVIVMTHRAGFRIKEVAVIMHPDLTDDSMHRGMTDIYYVFKMFLSIIVTLLRNPLKERS